ncbi:MAG: hypothetical protein HYR62_01985 [Actinobacteria bacterium]|nr:hypothetical protein [Actinomycetota bacterium]MBI3687253.1 hypothetical protein [Actinomycetota bacterium]
MTADDTVVPLPRPSRAAVTDRNLLARSILAHRHWCVECRPHADDVAEALGGVPMEDIARRRRGTEE